jgi:hypothetical protein
MDLWQEENEALNADLSSTDFENLCDEAFELRESMDELKLQMKELNEELNRKQERIMAHLEQVGKVKHAGRKGSISMTVQSYPSMPKETAKKQVFFAWLKSKGLYESMITVNSNTLRGFYKAEKEASDNDPDFSIPGLEPFERVGLTYRKGK